MENKKPFAIYTIDEQVYVKEENGVFKQTPEIFVKTHKFLGIPIKRIYSEKININKNLNTNYK